MNLSLEVARIIMPHLHWYPMVYSQAAEGFDEDCGMVAAQFDHTTPEALGQMALWYVKTDPIVFTGQPYVGIEFLLMAPDPNEALAGAIVEAHNG